MNTDKENDTSVRPFEDLAWQYDSWYDEEGKLIFAIEADALLGVLDGLPEPWLEIGAGSGRFACRLGIEYGIEPSLKMVEMSRNRGIEVRQGRGEERIFAAVSFGTVFIILTLCFLDSPEEVLREARRILKPGGKLVLGLILKDSAWGKYYEEKKRQGHHFYRLSRFFSYDEIEAMLTGCGFMVDDIRSTLYQQPGKVKQRETAQQGLERGAGFTVIVASKNSERG